MRPVTESQTNPTDGRLQSFVQDIAARLERLGETEALSRFNNGLASGTLPPNAKLPEWLARTIGPQATLQLITLYAREHCYCCRGGVEPCDSCDGHGHLSDGDVCAQCLGLGVAPCDFCAGSGLAAYDAVPPGLKVPVALRRIHDTVSHVTQFLDQPVPPVRESEPAQGLRESAKALSDLNRAVGVFENGLLFSRGRTDCGSKAKAELARVVRSSVRCAVACRSRMRKLLEIMAASARLAAQSTLLDHSHQAISLRQAVFYESLLDRANPFVDTGFEHAFLEKAMAASA